MNTTACCKWLIPLMALAAAGCSSGPSGDYGGADCGLYDNISFRDNGKVYLTVKMFGMQMGETAGDFTVDDDKIIVTANNQTTVFTLNDDGDLESSMLGEKITCRKGAGKASASKAPEQPPTSLSGSFGGVACMLDKMTFHEDGNVELYVAGDRKDATYRLKGDKVTIDVEGDAVEFTLAGDFMEATIEGQRTMCSRM